MMTTLDLNVDLLRVAKLQASASGVTLKAFVEEALRVRLQDLPEIAKAFRLDLPVVQGERAPAVDGTAREALYDFLEKDP